MARLPYLTPEQLPASERGLFDEILARFGRVNQFSLAGRVDGATLARNYQPNARPRRGGTRSCVTGTGAQGGGTPGCSLRAGAEPRSLLRSSSLTDTDKASMNRLSFRRTSRC
jgi:hypothetical protein